LAFIDTLPDWQNIMREWKTAQSSRSCPARPVQFLRDLAEQDKRWALKRCGKDRGVGRTA
jgi:hypothetical protein